MSNINMDELQRLKEQFTKDFSAQKIKSVVRDTGRFYIIGDIEIPMSPNVEEVLIAYRDLVLNKQNESADFDKLNKCNIYVGQPDTGKTYKALNEGEQMVGQDRCILLMCNAEVTLNTLLECFSMRDGHPTYTESIAMKLISDPQDRPAIIVLDEFNTMNTNAMKSCQPLFDTTSKTFTFRGEDGNGNSFEKIFHKNPNCKFILTMNEKDKGVSILPDAILSRSRITYFKPTNMDTLATWTNKPIGFIEELHKLYESLGLSSIFGTRQVNACYGMDTAGITSHLQGLLALRGMPDSVSTTTEVVATINKLAAAYRV